MPQAHHVLALLQQVFVDILTEDDFLSRLGIAGIEVHLELAGSFRAPRQLDAELSSRVSVLKSAA